MPAMDPIVRISAENNGRLESWDENLRDRLLSFEYADKERGVDEVKLTLANDDMTLRQDSRLVIGSKLAILFGYPGRTRLITFEIKVRKGFDKIAIEGSTVEATTFLTRARMRTWEDATEWEVAEEIARGMGFTSPEQLMIEVGDGIEIRRTITQAAETDWALLQRLAQRVGAVCYTSGGVFHFHPPRLGEPPLKTVTYWDSDEGEFLSTPEIDEMPAGRPGRVTRRGVSTRERTAVSGTAGDSDDAGRPVMGYELTSSDPTGWEELAQVSPTERRELDAIEFSPEMVAPTSEPTAEGAHRSARRDFRNAELATVKLEASLVGDPDLVAGENIRILGLGDDLSGNYHIVEAVHSIGSGYQTKLTARRNALGRASANSARRRQARDDSGRDVADGNGERPMTPVVETSGWVNDTEGRETRAPEMWEGLEDGRPE